MNIAVTNGPTAKHPIKKRLVSPVVFGLSAALLATGCHALELQKLSDQQSSRILGTREIKNLLVNKRFGSEIEETFSPDGVYVRVTEGRELVGTYKIRRGLMCMTKYRGHEECRYVARLSDGKFYWLSVPDKKLLWRITSNENQ